MPGPETQTFDTAGGQASPAQPEPQAEIVFPPQIAEALDKYRGAVKRLRKQFRPSSPDGKAIKQELTNYVLPEVEGAFLILAQAFVETFQLFSYLQADFHALREHVLPRLGGSPLVDGDVSEEQITDTRRAFAQLGLLIAQPEIDREAVNDAFNELLACFNELLDVDLSPEGEEDEADDEPDDEAGEPDADGDSDADADAPAAD